MPQNAPLYIHLFPISNWCTDHLQFHILKVWHLSKLNCCKATMRTSVKYIWHLSQINCCKATITHLSFYFYFDTCHKSIPDTCHSIFTLTPVITQLLQSNHHTSVILFLLWHLSQINCCNATIRHLSFLTSVTVIVAKQQYSPFSWQLSENLFPPLLQKTNLLFPTFAPNFPSFLGGANTYISPSTLSQIG
jgi:hypothetical protein